MKNIKKHFGEAWLESIAVYSYLTIPPVCALLATYVVISRAMGG